MTWLEYLETFIFERLSVTKYHKHYSATVMSLTGDSADVVPDSDDIKGIGGLQSVPVYWGTPGIKATITPGAKVTLFFEDGDPKKPRIMNWQSGALTITLADGAAPVARSGDTVTGQVVVPPGASGGTFPILGGVIAGGNPKVLG